jgi:hypothetical protein
MNGQFLGSCLCGSVRFRSDGEFDGFYLCHCGRCRKGTGTAHAANLFSRTATLAWISGESGVTRFNLSPTRHTRCFCSTCGSALPYVQASGALLVVPAGSLDTDVATRPNAHIFVGNKAGWDNALETVPEFEGFPA